MLLEAPKPTEEQLREATEIEQAGQNRLKAKRESFERCDTDGFLTQWAHGVNADKDRMQAAILRNGGYAEFPVLVDTATGEVVADKVYTFDNTFAGFGTVTKWKVDVAKYGRKWLPTGPKSRVQKTLGLEEQTRWFPAYADLKSNGTGMSGQVWTEAVRKFERKG